MIKKICNIKKNIILKKIQNILINIHLISLLFLNLQLLSDKNAKIAHTQYWIINKCINN